MLRLTGLAVMAAFMLGGIPGRAGALGAGEPSALPLYVILPFGEPGDTSSVLLHDTEQLAVDLANRRVRSTPGVPTDAVEAVANAHVICTQYGASGLLVSEMRFSQTNSLNVPELAVGFIPWVGGVIAGQGGLNRTPIEAQYKLFFVDCRGKVAWRTMTTAQKVHHGSNLSAGLTEISFQAIEQAAEQFAARRPQAHETPH